jgi:hypothetical protein
VHYQSGNGSSAERQWKTFKKMGAYPRSAAILAEIMGVIRVDSTVEHNTAGIRFVGGGMDEPIVNLSRPSLENFEDQLRYLRAAADLRFDRQAEIETQVGDLTPFFGALSYLSSSSNKWTLEMYALIQRTCQVCEMRLKQLFDCPRPIAFAQEVQPMIQTPGHGTWPSGHATEAFAAATLMAYLTDLNYKNPVKGVRDQLPAYRLAARIALNRTVAGVHFPTDSVAGAALGIGIAELIINYSRGAKKASSYAFNGGAFDGDFNLTLLGETMPPAGESGSNPTITKTEFDLPTKGRTNLLSKLWDAAADEWAD